MHVIGLQSHPLSPTPTLPSTTARRLDWDIRVSHDQAQNFTHSQAQETDESHTHVYVDAHVCVHRKRGIIYSDSSVSPTERRCLVGWTYASVTPKPRTHTDHTSTYMGGCKCVCAQEMRQRRGDAPYGHTQQLDVRQRRGGIKMSKVCVRFGFSATDRFLSRPAWPDTCR